MNLIHDLGGQVSAMRVGFLAAVGTACTSVLAPIFLPDAPPADTTLVLALLAGGFGGKAAQRVTEERGRAAG